MNNQLETINKFLECYKAEVNNHSTDGEYNKYSFRLVTTNEWSYNSRTEALSKDVESRFQGIYNSFEYEPFDEVRGCTDCIITLGLEMTPAEEKEKHINYYDKYIDENADDKFQPMHDKIEEDGIKLRKDLKEFLLSRGVDKIEFDCADYEGHVIGASLIMYGRTIHIDGVDGDGIEVKEI